MKRFNRSTQKNKGFSLVEVLVAMTVIALISIPLIRTFVISANYTRDARRLQNATDIAQNVSEYFKVIPLDELKDVFRDDRNISSSVLFDDADIASSGAYVFQNVGGGSLDENGIPYYEGADGEDFYVTVVLNPTDYTDINNYISPEVGDLFSVDIITAFSQFTKYDNKIIKTLKRTYGSAIPDDTGYDDIKKTVYVNIDQSQNLSNPNKIDYEYSLTVRYTYCKKIGELYQEQPQFIEYSFLLAEGTLDDCGVGLPDLYLLYTPYDINDPLYNGDFARDDFYINYRKGQVREAWEEKVNVYIVQQTVPATNNGLNIENVYLDANIRGKELAVNGDSSVSGVDVYANIINWPGEMKVTAGSASMVNLYSLDVYIWYGEKDTTDIEEYVDGSFKPDSHYTLISTIKEE